VSQEQLAVLKMLEEGKIGVDEAERLLKAMGEGSGTGQRSQGQSHSGADAVQGFDFSSFAENLSEMISGGLKGFGIGGNSYRFEEEFTGEFDTEGPVKIYLRSTNGRIAVKGWNQPGYKLVLKKTVRGDNEEEAKAYADELAEVTTGSDSIAVEQRKSGWLSAGVRIEAYVPSSLRYNLDLNTSNGRIGVADLDCDIVRGHTSNGRVVLDNVESPDIQVRTTNGTIVSSGARGNLEAKTTNGSIKVKPAEVSGEINYNLRTSNGSIKVDALTGPEYGYYVDASTSMGKVSLDIGEMVYEKEDRAKVGRSHVIARTADFADKENKINVTMKTSNGSIKVRPGIL